MQSLNDKERKELLRLARSVITAKLHKGSKIHRPDETSPSMLEKRGCFVTLHKDGLLRGCIGTIEPVRRLIDNVEENAVNAAFRDPRFPPVLEDELSVINIEISVLTVPEILPFENGKDLKNKLKPGIHGVILTNDWRSSTFLPQVWEQLPEKNDFLEHLCLKGGMGRNCWNDTNTVVKTYTAEYFSE